MAFMGLNPEKARTLSSTMRQTGQAADDLSSQVTAALTLSQLESDLPGQMIFISDELEQLGLIIEARVDIAEGFVIDPTRLAADIGITLAQAEAAIAAFADPEAKPKQITPFIDALAANKQAAEILRSSIVNMPALGTDPELDQALLRLATWLPDALETGKAPALTEDQVRDLGQLANSAEISGAVSSVGSEIVGNLAGLAEAFADAAGGVPINLADLNPEQLAGYGNALFEKVAETFELDQRLRAAAGLPTVEDMLLQAQIQADRVSPFDTKFEALDAWLPQFTVGELDAADLPQTSADRYLLLEFARQFAYKREPDVQTLADFEALTVTAQEGVFNRALEYFRRARWAQKSLIPGDFEAVEGPIIVWSEQGVESALLAGRRQGVITEETERIANLVADNVLVDNPDGSDTPIELNQEQQQALVAAIIAQNGEAFVMDSPNIQRQIVSAINLVKQQTTLAGQRTVFAKAIEAFRSLNAVGSPAVTWRQLQEIVGDEVVDELGHERLTARSAGDTSGHPQFITLINHWGIPGEDTIKMKKRKFSFRFDENGALARVRNKKLSKWKRFKNSVKAFGKALWSEWKDNPWKYLFMGHAGLLPGANQFAEGVEQGDFDEAVEGGYTMTKFAASIAATVFPATTAAGIAAMAVLAADTIYQASQGDWLGALGSAFSVAGGAAGYIGDVAAIGSTANMVSNAAAVGEGVVKAIDIGDDFVDAVKDGDVFAALGSGFSIAGSAAKIVGSASELANGVGAAMSGIPVPEVVSALTEGSLALDPSLLTEGLTHSVVSSDTIGLIGEIGETASNLGSITSGIDSTLTAINNDNIAGALTSGLMTLGRTAGTIANPDGVIDNAFSPGTLDTLRELGVSSVQLAQMAHQAGFTLNAIDQGNLAGAVVGGISTVGTGIDAATNDRGIIDDALGTSEKLEGQIRSGGVSLQDLGSAVGSGFVLADAIDSGDLTGALASGFTLAGDAADLAVNKDGLVAGLANLDPKTIGLLTEFGGTTSDQLAGLSIVGGRLADGQILAGLDGLVDVGRIGLDKDNPEHQRLLGQLKVADKALGLGRYVDGVADGRHGIDLQSLALGLGGLGRAIVDVPDAPIAQQPSILGKDTNGNTLIDDNNDGVADRAIRLASASQPGPAATRGVTIELPVGPPRGRGVDVTMPLPAKPLSSAQQDAIVDLAAQEETAARIDAAVLGSMAFPSPPRPDDLLDVPPDNVPLPSPPRPTDDFIFPSPPRPTDLPTEDFIFPSPSRPVDLPTEDFTIPSPPKPTDRSTDDFIFPSPPRPTDLPTTPQDGPVLPSPPRPDVAGPTPLAPGVADALVNLAKEAEADAVRLNTAEPSWTDDFGLREEALDLARGETEASEIESFETFGPGTDVTVGLGPVGITRTDSVQKTASEQVRIIPTTDPDDPRVVMQSGDLELDFWTLIGKAGSGMVGLGGGGGQITGGDVHLSRVTAPASQIDATGELPNANPTDLAVDNEVLEIDLSVTEPGVLGVGEVELGGELPERVERVLPVGVEASGTISLEMDSTDLGGRSRFAHRINETTTKVGHSNIELVDAETALKGSIKAEAGIKPIPIPGTGSKKDPAAGTASKDDPGVGVGAGAHGQVKVEVLEQSFSGTTDGISVEHPAGADSIDQHFDDGVVELEQGESYTSSTGTFDITTRMAEGGFGGGGKFKLGVPKVKNQEGPKPPEPFHPKPKNPSALKPKPEQGPLFKDQGSAGSSGMKFEFQDNALIDRVELHQTEEKRHIAAEDRVIDSITGAHADDPVFEEIDKTLAVDDNNFSIGRTETGPPNHDLIDSDFLFVHTENTVSTKNGSFTGTDEELKELAKETLANNPSIENNFLEDLASGEDPALAADKHNSPSHLTDLFEDPINDGADALFSEDRRQEREELLEGLPDNF